MILLRPAAIARVSKWAKRALVRQLTKNPMTLIELQSFRAKMVEPAAFHQTFAVVWEDKSHFRCSTQQPKEEHSSNQDTSGQTTPQLIHY